MGQKIHPTGFRLAVNRNWASKWYANSKNFATMLAEDIKVREYLKKKLAHAAVSRITIERPAKNARITISQRASGVVIGKKGEDIENAERRAAQDDGRAGRPQHRGDPQARDRRAADRRLDRPAAREADHVPPRDEARDAERDAPRRAGHQDDELGPPERHRDRAHRVVPRRPRAAAHAARRHRLRLLRSEDDVRRHRHQVLGVQGRPPRQRRSAEHQHAGRRRGRPPQAPRPASGRPAARRAAARAPPVARWCGRRSPAARERSGCRGGRRGRQAGRCRCAGAGSRRTGRRGAQGAGRQARPQGADAGRGRRQAQERRKGE